MAKKLEVLYPGKTVVDANNTFGTFKNRTDDILKDGTPYEQGWASDLWGFAAHILKKAGLTPNSVQENETTSQYYDGLESLLGNKEVYTESKELILDLLSTTDVKLDAVRLSTLDSSFIPSFIDDLDTTLVMPTDLMAATIEKTSTWYQIWIDKEEIQLLVPDLTGTTDGTGAGLLIDSANTFFTDLVKAGDKVRNRTDGTETIVQTTPTVDGASLDIVDDIFVSGEDYEIRLLSPTGIDDSKILIGQVYNDGSGDFTKIEKYGRARVTIAYYRTTNGAGSGSTNIRKWSVEEIASNDIVGTIINDATLGNTITANMPCKASIIYTDTAVTPAIFCISLNSTQLTTSPYNITDADRLCSGRNFADGTPANMILSDFPLEKGDVLRAHYDATADSASNNRGSIIIILTEIT